VLEVSERVLWRWAQLEILAILQSNIASHVAVYPESCLGLGIANPLHPFLPNRLAVKVPRKFTAAPWVRRAGRTFLECKFWCPGGKAFIDLGLMSQAVLKRRFRKVAAAFRYNYSLG
jgi:hypothetical protein